MKKIQLGSSELHVTPIGLGTMTFGEQVNEVDSHAILQRSVEHGINFLDTAEMYAVPPSAATYNATETIIGNWLAQHTSLRQNLVIATKVAGPSRSMPWIRGGSLDPTPEDIITACEGSLRRLQIDAIDLYQIHWPTRRVPAFGGVYFDPQPDEHSTTMLDQLQALTKLVRDGKIRAIGLSNETPYGVHEFVRLAEQHQLPVVATVQNPYSLLNRTVENGLDETMHRLGIGLLAYSPLAFGLLTGKYDASGIDGEAAPQEGRMTKYASMRQQRWGRHESLSAAKRYNQLAIDHGMTPTQMALAFCYQKWQVASTLIGVTSLKQLDECIAAYGTKLSPELLAKIDAIRWEIRDPAQ